MTMQNPTDLINQAVAALGPAAGQMAQAFAPAVGQAAQAFAPAVGQAAQAFAPAVGQAFAPVAAQVAQQVAAQPAVQQAVHDLGQQAGTGAREGATAGIDGTTIAIAALGGVALLGAIGYAAYSFGQKRPGASPMRINALQVDPSLTITEHEGIRPRAYMATSNLKNLAHDSEEMLSLINPEDVLPQWASESIGNARMSVSKTLGYVRGEKTRAR